MYLIKVMERFRSQEACIQHLEQVRWGKGYPHCRNTQFSLNVGYPQFNGCFSLVC